MQHSITLLLGQIALTQPGDVLGHCSVEKQIIVQQSTNQMGWHITAECCGSNAVSRPDLREPFYFSIWLGQGVMWGGHSIFCFLGFFISMFWPGMVLNQGQLSIVVSDWESYLGSPFFPPFSVGS